MEEKTARLFYKYCRVDDDDNFIEPDDDFTLGCSNCGAEFMCDSQEQANNAITINKYCYNC